MNGLKLIASTTAPFFPDPLSSDNFLSKRQRISGRSDGNPL
jgi:hypothetical protein